MRFDKIEGDKREKARRRSSEPIAGRKMRNRKKESIKTVLP